MVNFEKFSIMVIFKFFIFCLLFISSSMGQFRFTLIGNNLLALQNYKTDNPIYDLQNHFTYSPEFRLGVQGADVVIFSLGLQYQFMGGENFDNKKIGAYYFLFPLSTTFLWKISHSHFQWYLDAGLQYGFQLFTKYGEQKGILYYFNEHYWGFYLAPGIEYKINSQFSVIFQSYYTLQINDASKNFFIGKFHHYGIKLGFRYLKYKDL